MAYKKYIKRGDKIYGPYVYHSRRVDGKVISEYHGSTKKDYSKFFLFGGLVIFAAVMIYFLALNGSPTGKAVLDLNANYNEGQPFQGLVKISLQEGELLPENSKVTFDNNGDIKKYDLKDFIKENTTQGNYYVSGSNVSGSGQGYGIPGTKEVFPYLDFVLVIESEIKGDNETVNLKEIPEKVSAEEPFLYSLQEGEIKAELKPKSVKTNEKQLDDNDVSITTQNNTVKVTTSYKETEEGFGQDYTSNGKKEIIINVSSLGLFFQPGNLNVSIDSNGTGIFSLSTILQPGDISITETQPNQNLTNEIQTNQSQTTNITIPNPELTPQEKEVLVAAFGNVSLNAKEAKEKNGFIIIKYELGNYNIEYSYSSDLSNETLNLFMESDRIKWLKDIAGKLLQQEEKEKELPELEGNYTIQNGTNK